MQKLVSGFLFFPDTTITLYISSPLILPRPVKTVSRSFPVTENPFYPVQLPTESSEISPIFVDPSWRKSRFPLTKIIEYRIHRKSHLFKDETYTDPLKNLHCWYDVKVICKYDVKVSLHYDVNRYDVDVSIWRQSELTWHHCIVTSLCRFSLFQTPLWAP